MFAEEEHIYKKTYKLGLPADVDVASDAFVVVITAGVFSVVHELQVRIKFSREKGLLNTAIILLFRTPRCIRQ